MFVKQLENEPVYWYFIISMRNILKFYLTFQLNKQDK